MEDRDGQGGNPHPEPELRRVIAVMRAWWSGTIIGMDWGIIIYTLYYLVYPYVTYNDVYVRRFLRGVDVSFFTRFLVVRSVSLSGVPGGGVNVDSLESAAFFLGF